ncbi:hypothetical protein ACIRJR_09530 [Streptomyces sp. NPDC102402]|uniref:hypothetical protein n=1 Tax=Streptomyces sp. NPDC102402 TaxID=3366169 RepID=UPI0037FCC923
MPEWMPYALAVVLVLTVAARVWAAAARPADSSVRTPCASTDCRGLQTVHHVTESGGLRCAECGHYAGTS